MHHAAVSGCLFAIIFIFGCSSPPPAEPPEYTQSKLFKYLRSGQRDRIYCAASFITLKNCPQYYLNPIPQSREEWLEIARKYVRYLNTADSDITLLIIEGFPEYTVTWREAFPPDEISETEKPQE